MSPVRERLLALPLDEQKILGLLAVVHEAVHRTAALEWVKVAGLRKSKERQYSGTDLAEIFKHFDELDLITLESAVPYGSMGYSLTGPARHAVLAQLSASAELQGLVDLVRRQEPLAERYRSVSYSRLARELCLAMYLGPDAELLRLLRSWDPRSGYLTREQLLLLAFSCDAPEAGLDRVGLEIAELYARGAYQLACERLVTLGDGLHTWLARHRAEVGADTLAHAALYHGLRGQGGFALSLLTGGDDDDGKRLGARAFALLTTGDVPSAREAAAAAVERTRAKKSTKNVKGLEGPLSSWLCLLLVTSAQSESLALGGAQLLSRARPKDPGVLAALQAILGHVANVPSVGETELEHFLIEKGWERYLMIALALRIRGTSGVVSTSYLPRALTNLALAAERAGFVWLQGELTARVANAPGVLGGLYRSEEPWERALRALEGALAAVEPLQALEPTGPEASERLVWVIVTEGAAPDVTARIQTRNQTGWSSGRQVTWKKLAETPAETAWLSDDDRRVMRHIHLQREYAAHAGTHVLDPRAALSLVGHRRVFRADDMRQAVEVAQGKVKLDVRERDGQIAIQLQPEALLSLPVVWEADGAARFIVYALDATQQQLAAQLKRKEGIVVPDTARDRVKQALSRLVAHFPIASEIGVDAAHIEQVASDARIFVRLRRHGPSLLVRVCVAPLGEGPVFAPGQGSEGVLGTVTSDARMRTVRATRDLALELTRASELFACCPLLRDVTAGQREGRVDELESCLDLLCELQSAPDFVVAEWPEGTPLTVLPVRDVKNIQLRLSGEAGWLSAEGDLDVDPELKLGFRELLALRAGKRGRFLQLSDGRFLALTDSLTKLLDGMNALGTGKRGDETLTLHPLALGMLAGLSDALGDMHVDKHVKKQLARVREAAALAPVVPFGFEAELRPYQLTGYAWLCRLVHMRAGACLADDMGLGKTLQALALLLAQAEHGPSLVVAPTSVCPNWVDEARRFAPSLRVTRLGPGPRAKTIDELGPFDVLVCSYGVLQQEIDALEKKHFRIAVVDEAQAIKNAATQRTRAVMRIVADARIALTGTPVENHLGELWSIMTFLNPGYLGSAKAFEERFLKPIQRDGDVDAAHLLKRLVRPFMLRRKKGEVLDDLPEKTVITLRVEPSAEELALFAALREEAAARLAEGDKPGEARMRLFAELMRMRRAACHPDLVAPEARLPSSKLATFEALLEELRSGGHRVLVFSQFVDYLKLIRTRLDALTVKYQYLDGSCSSNDREKSVKAFQAGHGDVFLISLKAGGFGLNLTAADYVIHLDPWWNPAVEDQASDRAHRMGQTRPVTVYRLVMQGSIEEKILALHAEKRDLADQMLEGTGTTAALSIDELTALLKDASGDSLPPADGRVKPERVLRPARGKRAP